MQKIWVRFSLVLLLCSMVYQHLWVIQCQSYPCRRTVMVLLYCHLQHHNDTIIKTQEDFLINICTSHFIVRVRKGLLKVCVWEGFLEGTETSIFWPPLLWLATLCLSRFPDAQPKAQRPTLLGAGFLYFILSATSLYPNSSGPQGLFGLMWLSLPHLVSLHPISNCNSWLLSWLSYIIVQRPLSRLLDF